MSVMENTLLRTAQNEGHVCPNPERSEGRSGGGTELFTSTSRGGIKKLGGGTELYTSTSRGGKEGTPRVLEVV